MDRVSASTASVYRSSFERRRPRSSRPAALTSSFAGGEGLPIALGFAGRAGVRIGLIAGTAGVTGGGSAVAATAGGGGDIEVFGRTTEPVSGTDSFDRARSTISSTFAWL